MTRGLGAALAEVSTLAPEEQDALAVLVMDEINSEQRWTVSFAKSQTLLDSLAAEALTESSCLPSAADGLQTQVLTPLRCTPWT